MDEEKTIQIIKERIISERRKHKNLDWEEIAARKIYKSLVKLFAIPVVSGSFSADDINEAYELGRKEQYNGSPMTGDEVASKWNDEEFKLEVRQVYF